MNGIGSGLTKVFIEITRKASRQANIDEIIFEAKNLNAWKPQVYNNKTLDLKKSIHTFREHYKQQ